MTGTKQTGDDVDEALDARLAALTDPGEDPAFRAQVLARIEGAATPVAHGGRARPALVTVSVAAVLVAVAFLAWRASAPSAPHDARVVVEGQSQMVPPTSPANPIAVAAADRDEGTRVETAATTRLDARRARAARAGAPSVTSLVTSAADVAGDEALPYGMERVRLEPVSIQPFALRAVREDPMMAALAPPEPVRVDPIDIAEIAPRR